MNACQIRVITNGYIVSYMAGAQFIELCFTSRAEMLGFIAAVLDKFAPAEKDADA